ncbi:hypothetical protein QTN25_003225 [Entamoeba marina]
MSRLKRSNFFVFTQPSPPSQQIEKDQNSFLFSEKIQTPVVNGLFNSTTSPNIEDDMNSVDDINSDEKEYIEDNEEQGCVDNTEFEFDFYCSLNGEDASDLSVYDCDTIENFNPLKRDLIIFIDEVINLPNELKSVSIKTDYVKMTINESIEITTLTLQTQSELFIDNEASIETSVSLDIMNSDSISLFVNSQSVTRFYGNELDSVEVNGILQIEKDISINELVMILDDYDANLVKDTANTGLRVSNSYDAQKIKLYEDCKISSKESNIPDDAKCPSTPKYCNYIVSGGSYNIKDDIGGIEGTDFTITGEDERSECYGTCELYGDIDVDKIERSIGQYFVHDSVSIRSVGEGKENLVITGNERSIVSLIAETFSGINVNMKAGCLLENISNEINNGYIEIDETAAMVVFESYVVFDNSVISLSNNLHNAIALHEQSLISFNKNSQIQIRVYSVVKEIASPIEVTKKCDIWLVLNSNSSTLCPTSPFNMKGVPVVTIPLKWTAKKRVFMLLMFIIIASSSLLSLLYLIYSLVSSTRRHALRSV